MKILLIPLALLLAAGCKTPSSKNLTGFPEETRLDSSMRTVFVPVPDHPGEPGDNIVYAASFALAWNELCEILNSDLGSVDPLIRRLNASRAQPKPLEPGEYTSEAKVEGRKLTVTASFFRNLPFAVPFGEIGEGLVFARKQRVKAFGMKPYDEAMAAQVQVLYYESDERFVLRVHTSQASDEMLLARGFADGVKLGTLYSRVEAAITKGAAERKDPDNWWKFSLLEDDEIVVPEVRFHLHARYRELVGQAATVKGEMHEILEAAQTTAFVLDKEGVIVESDAVIMDSAAAVIGDQLPVKHLYFDEPFVIILRKKTAETPYFMMKVGNAELMEGMKE